MLIPSQNGDYVASIPLALKLEAKMLDRWKKKFPPAPYSPGSTLFYRGHNPYGVFVIFSGRVELKVSETNDHTVLEVEPGSVVGLGSAILDRPYPLTAVAKNRVQAAFVPKQVLKAWIGKKETLFPKEIRLLLKKPST